MSAAVCQKRHFEEIHGSPVPLSKRRCSGNSPVRFSGFSRSSSPGLPGTSLPDTLSQLRALFPGMDEQLVAKVLENCGNNLDDAIKCLNDLHLSGESPTSSHAMAQAPQSPTQQQQQASVSSEGLEWVELFVREMQNAADINDARARATRALESFEKVITARNAGAAESIQKENETLKSQLHVLVRDNTILKRAVAIQHERYTLETEERTKEVKHLKQIADQYQEQLRTLELSNYALTMHLRRAQENTSIPGRFHPDVF